MAEEVKKEAVKKTAAKPAAKKAAAPKKAVAKKTEVKEEVKTEAKAEVKAVKKPAAKKAAAPKKAEAKAEVKEEAKAEEKVEVKETEKVVKTEEKKEAIPEFKTRKPLISDYEALLGMHVTEKSQNLQINQNKMTFVVPSTVTADQVKAAVQAVFGVKVDKVNTMNVRAKSKRAMRYQGHVPGFKKAIVSVNKAYNLGEIAKAASADAANK